MEKRQNKINERKEQNKPDIMKKKDKKRKNRTKKFKKNRNHKETQ